MKPEKPGFALARALPAGIGTWSEGTRAALSPECGISLSTILSVRISFVVPSVMLPAFPFWPPSVVVPVRVSRAIDVVVLLAAAAPIDLDGSALIKLPRAKASTMAGRKAFIGFL